MLLPECIEKQRQALVDNQGDLSVCGAIAFRGSFEFREIEHKLKNEACSLPYLVSYNSLLEEIKRGLCASYNRILISKEKVVGAEGFEVSLRAGEEGNLNLKLVTRFPNLKVINLSQKLLLKRIRDDSLAVQSKTQKEIPYSLLSIQNAAEYYLKKSNNNPNQDLKRFIFDKLYFQLIYAYRSSKLHYVPPAFEIWKSANLPSPPLNPLYHHLFHRYLGFWQAEELLDILRKFKNKLPIIK